MIGFEMRWQGELPSLIVGVFFILLNALPANAKRTGTASPFPSEPDITVQFDGKSQETPGRILVLEPHLDETSNVFFLNQDYIRTYSSIVEFNLEERREVRRIISYRGGKDRISEIVHDNRYIAWVVSLEEGDRNFASIFCFDSGSGEVKPIKQNIITGADESGGYPLQLHVGGGRLVWLEHDPEKRMTNIMVSRLDMEWQHRLVAVPFVESFEEFPMATTSFGLFENEILFDQRMPDGSMAFFRYDLRDGSHIDNLMSQFGARLHYASFFDGTDGLVAVYAKSFEAEDFVYLLNLQERRAARLVRFYPNYQIYRDVIRIAGPYVYYTVQANISGPVIDHYYSEIYDLESMSMHRMEGGIDMSIGTHHVATLRFPPGGEMTDVLFEFSSRESVSP